MDTPDREANQNAIPDPIDVNDDSSSLADMELAFQRNSSLLKAVTRNSAPLDEVFLSKRSS